AAAPSAAHQSMVFVNLPVKELARSVEFFTRVGYRFNQQFTDENATCMVISDVICAMLVVEPYFRTFTDKPLADAKVTTESITALSLGSRQEVDALVERALAAGGRQHKEALDHGFMYERGFEDLDGHIWEYVWMDPSHMQG